MLMIGYTPSRSDGLYAASCFSDSTAADALINEMSGLMNVPPNLFTGKYFFSCVSTMTRSGQQTAASTLMETSTRVTKPASFSVGRRDRRFLPAESPQSSSSPKVSPSP